MFNNSPLLCPDPQIGLLSLFTLYIITGWQARFMDQLSTNTFSISAKASGLTSAPNPGASGSSILPELN